MSRQTSNSKTRTIKPKPIQVGLFDMLNQTLSEFVHTEHIPAPFPETVEECIANKKLHPNGVDPVVFAFSPVAYPPEGLFSKYVELLRARYLRNLAQIFANKETDFSRFHHFYVKQAILKPELFEFITQLAVAASENDPQNLADMFMKTSFSLYSQYISDRSLLPYIVRLIFAHTESDEASRDSRVEEILSCIQDEETQYIVLAHTVMEERIFSSKLCDLYSAHVESGLQIEAYQPYAVHILRYLAPIKGELLQNYLDKITELVEDERCMMQCALVQLLVEATQETLLLHIIEKTNRLEILSLALHLVSELGSIPGPLLIALFKKIGGDNIETVCTERCTVESPVGPIQLGRLTNTWNSAAVNATVIAHIQTVNLPQWDVEFALCKLLLKQPMDSTSAGIWKQLFGSLAPQFGDLMREEDMTEVVFDIVGFYLVATLDIDFFEKLQPALEPVVTVAKEKCKNAATKFLTKVAELSPRFKQIVSTLILV